MKSTDPIGFSEQNLIRKLRASQKQSDSKTWLYENGLRTEAFMTESLFRLYEKGLGKNEFRGGLKLAKKLEDALGQIDFYDVFDKEFRKNKKINKDIEAYILKKKEKAFKKFEKIIYKRNGLENRVKEHYAVVKEQQIKFNAAEIKKIENAVRNEINEIKEFVEKTQCEFKYIEEEVHELRRKLRWISMYGQSLCGIIQLKASGKKEKWERKYLTKNVVNSPFNKLPVHRFPSHIYFDKNRFYALSWIINELGELKDKGLRLELLAKVITKTQKIDHKTAIKKAEHALASEIDEATVLKKASAICNSFFNEDKILDGLIIKR